MKKKKADSLSLKFDKQQISKLTSFKGKSIDYACAHGVMGGDHGNASNTCHTFAADCDTCDTQIK
ncbi:hypothetical protein [Aquimarina megaterium]|uniref:hypothetical protein n=1 Tax=Aquimarina megaterium TaxID=1443666 RepID=UPI00046EC1F5|nr:hypothetical protein [Aquimarina megaterium]